MNDTAPARLSQDGDYPSSSRPQGRLSSQQLRLLRLIAKANFSAKVWLEGHHLLAEFLGLDLCGRRAFTASERASVSRSLRKLLAAGYVTRHPENRRLWAITRAGCENLIRPPRGSRSSAAVNKSPE